MMSTLRPEDILTPSELDGSSGYGRRFSHRGSCLIRPAQPVILPRRRDVLGLPAEPGVDLIAIAMRSTPGSAGSPRTSLRRGSITGCAGLIRHEPRWLKRLP